MGKMFDKPDLEKIRARLEQADREREVLIKSSRDVIKLSKLVINLVHRGELKKAEPFVKSMTEELTKLRRLVDKDKRLHYSGSFKAAEQEYVEAVAFFELMKSGKMPTIASLKMDDEHYILGVCDLTGELVRKAINSVINDDYKTAKDIHAFVSELYEELSKFSFFSGELRKKYDSIKYDLKRLDDLMLSLKLKEKI